MKIERLNNGMNKCSKLIAEVDGKFVRLDGFPTDPLNMKRVVNTTKLTDDLMEAKNFYHYQEDIPTTQEKNPKVRFYDYKFTIQWRKDLDSRFHRPE